MRHNFVLPLPQFAWHPFTAASIAAVHLYLAFGHLSKLLGGEVQWTHFWKGFGALLGAYVFAALALRRVAKPLQRGIPSEDDVEESGSVSVPGRARSSTRPMIAIQLACC
jgi:hypothetical protein